jgi:LAGLIDADG DNA endonuclease family protein
VDDTDRDPPEAPEAVPAPRPAWTDEPDSGQDSPARPPWASSSRTQPYGRNEDDGLWVHALETGGLVTVLTFVAAVLIPGTVALWEITTMGGAVTAAAAWTALSLTDSVPLAVYLAAWGACLTGWITAARLAGPWHGPVIFALLLPALVLIPAGVTVIRRHRDRFKRIAETGRDTVNIRQCRYWEDLLVKFGVRGVAVRDVIKVEGGVQVHCRLGKHADGRRVITLDSDAIRDLGPRLAVHKRLPKGAVYIEEDPEGGSAADFIIHVRQVTGPRLARWLPAENHLLSINRPFGLGVLDSGREFMLKLREVVVFVCGVRGAGKALALDTPLATPSGWTTMGEIQAGDYVFNEAGQPCRVLAATEVMHGRPCYEIEFSDGTVITADAEHQWKVETDASRRSDHNKAARVLTPSPDARITACALAGPRCSPSGKIIGRGLCANHYENESNAGRRDQWPLQGPDHSQEHLRKRPEILTTEQMVPGLMVRVGGKARPQGQSNYSVRVAEPLQLPNANLLVPPYVLGAWLGDGHSASSRITTADPEILTEIENAGETVWIVPSTVKDGPRQEQESGVCALAGPSCSPSGKAVARRLCSNHYEGEKRAGRRDQWPTRFRDTVRRERLAAYTVGGLQARLRSLGVFENKHIPVSYLRASESQRLALLAGLLDTDGSCDEHGSVEFSNTNERLARDTYHLICSLGYKASIRSKTVWCNGKDCGTCWTVQFTPAEKVFRLTRKLARQVTSVRATAAHRYVVAIRPVPSVPVRCIEVDSPGHLYLAGESCIPTHNSTLLNVLTAQLCRMPDALIFWIDLKGGQEARAFLMPWILGLVDRPSIDWLATTREEADIMLDALKRAGTARSESGRHGRKLRPSPDYPAIIVICDETAQMTGHFIREDNISNTKLAVKLVQIAETYRSVAIDPVVSAVRAVVDVTGNSGLKAMAEVRIGMKVATAEEGRSIFPDNLPAAKQLAQLKDKGTGIPQIGTELYPPVHFYNISDGEPDDDGHPAEDRITPVVLATAARRPAPEQMIRDAMNAVKVKVGDREMGAYDARWEQPHMAHLIQAWREAAGVREAAPAPSGGPGAGVDEVLQRDPLLTEFEADLARPGIVSEYDDTRLHPAHKRMRLLLIGRGAEGYKAGILHTMLLAEGLTVARETVQRWLAADEKKGYVYRTGKPRSRWIWRLPEGAEFDIPGMDL